MRGIEGVNGHEEIRDGKKYWMGNEVKPCSLCSVAPTNVDDCGQFGNPYCPCFGVHGVKGIPDPSILENNTQE